MQARRHAGHLPNDHGTPDNERACQSRTSQSVCPDNCCCGCCCHSWCCGWPGVWPLTASPTATLERAGQCPVAASARSLARQLKPMGNGLLIDFPRAAWAILEADPVDRHFFTWSAPAGPVCVGQPHLCHRPHRPSWPRASLAHLISTTGLCQPTIPKRSAQPVRVVALYLSARRRDQRPTGVGLVQVARSK